MAEKQNSNEPDIFHFDDLFSEVGVQSAWRANSFTPSIDYSLEYVIAEVAETFEDSCVNIILEIFLADGTGQPTGSALASVTVLQELIPTAHAPITFTLASPLAVTNGNVYCLVLRSDAPEPTNTAQWWYGLTNTGLRWSSSDFGSTWIGGSTIPGFIFEIWGAGFEPPVNRAVIRRLCACAENIFWYEDI